MHLYFLALFETFGHFLQKSSTPSVRPHLNFSEFSWKTSFENNPFCCKRKVLVEGNCRQYAVFERFSSEDFPFVSMAISQSVYNIFRQILAEIRRNFGRNVLLGGLPPPQTSPGKPGGLPPPQIPPHGAKAAGGGRRNWCENRPPKNARLGSQMAVKSVISTGKKGYPEAVFQV